MITRDPLFWSESLNAKNQKKKFTGTLVQINDTKVQKVILKKIN